MLATQLNAKVSSGEVEQFTIIRVNNYVCNNVNNKKVIIITDIDVLEKGKEVGKKIGDPIQINADGTASSKPKAPVVNHKRKAEDLKEPAPKRSPLGRPGNSYFNLRL